jgi:hypothetical protein
MIFVWCWLLLPAALCLLVIARLIYDLENLKGQIVRKNLLIQGLRYDLHLLQRELQYHRRWP